MNTQDMFVTAARKKYRFNSGKGQLTTEDLFDLSLAALDDIAVALDKQVSETGRKSFISRRTESDTVPATKLEIVKFVIETIQAENDAKKDRADRAAQKEFLRDLLKKKQMQQLEGLPAEEIQKQLAALGD
jgi:hypothetical protein